MPSASARLKMSLQSELSPDLSGLCGRPIMAGPARRDSWASMARRKRSGPRSSETCTLSAEQFAWLCAGVRESGSEPLPATWPVRRGGVRACTRAGIRPALRMPCAT